MNTIGGAIIFFAGAMIFSAGLIAQAISSTGPGPAGFIGGILVGLMGLYVMGKDVSRPPRP